VIERVSVVEAMDALAGWPPPAQEAGVRWTPGLAIRIGEGTPIPDIGDTARARLRWVGDGIVAVHKRDLLDASNRLDRARRQGGWGAVSRDVALQVGGVWTARSQRTVLGLLARAPTEDSW
jgi:hypothetical protein